jgi:hypothetical protein
MKGKASKIMEAIAPLFMDENSKGRKKVSIGRMPLFTVLVIMCWRYFETGENPGEGILAFIALAMTYNGFSKTSAAQPNKAVVKPEITPDEEGD